MKRSALFLLFVWLAAPLAQCADNGADELLKAAKTAASARQFDEGLRLCERLIVEHPEDSVHCFNAQLTIATTLAAKGDLAEAAKAAHLAMDCAPNEGYYDTAAVLAASILSAMDQNVGRANQLLAFQQTGPANGAVNPLETIGYPSLPEREKTFEALREQAGDSPASSRLRAWTFLLSGKPREAFAQFADAFHRSTNPRDMQIAGEDLVSAGLRASRGHRMDQNKALQFVRFGPDGPDGKPNTADDIADPFAGILPAPPAAGEGGLAGLGAEELAALRHVRDAAKLYASDPGVEPRMRNAALFALQRANEALDDWGGAEQKDWYLHLVIGTDNPFQTDPALTGAQAAAKGRALHLGGITAFWNEIDASCAARGIEPTPAMANARRQLTTTTNALGRLESKPPVSKPLQKPASF